MPSLPIHYLKRPEVIDQIKTALILSTNQKISISGIHLGYSLQGMGGIGKSVIASALMRDEEVRRVFPDGLIWVSFSKKPDIISLQSQIAYIFQDDPPLFDNIQQNRSYLSKILTDKSCLLVLDDVWEIKHAAAFDVLGPYCQMLITTRNENVAIGMGVEKFRLDVLTSDEALELLRQSSNIPKELEIPNEASDIAKECGYLPLALAMIGSMLQNKPFQRWRLVLERLQKSEIEKIKFEFSNYPYPDLFKALQVSVEELEPQIQKHYYEMSIFPEGYYIPEEVFETYWKEDELLDYTPIELIDLFVDRSLAHRGFLEGISLHDLQFDYIRKKTDNIIQFHDKLLNAYSQKGSNGWSTVPDDGYYHRFLIYHLKGAEREVEAKEAARELLLNCFDMHPAASVRYLKLLGDEVNKTAKILIKKKEIHYAVKAKCLDLLGDEAKDIAKLFLADKTTHPYVVSRSLALLGHEAWDDANRLIVTCEDPVVICQCIKILGKDATDDAKRLIKSNKSQEVLCRCLDLLRYQALDDARRLLKSSKSHEVLCRCLDLLKHQASDDASILIKDNSTHPFVICKCFDILGQKAIDDAKKFVKISKSHEVLCRSLEILGEEGKDDAIRFLSKKGSHPYLICKCLDILGEEAKINSKMLLSDPQTHPHVISKCLVILGEEAKPIAKQKLQNWKNENKTLLVRCFQIANDTVEAKEAANEMLKLWNKSVPPFLRVAALRSSTDSLLRNERANKILTSWQRQFRPLVSAALSVYNNNPEMVAGYCKDIIQRYHAEITYQIYKKQKRYDGHILKALSNPSVRQEAELAAKDMVKIEENYQGFLTEFLYESAKCIIEGNWPSWIAIDEN